MSFCKSPIWCFVLFEFSGVVWRSKLVSRAALMAIHGEIPVSVSTVLPVRGSSRCRCFRRRWRVSWRFRPEARGAAEPGCFSNIQGSAYVPPATTLYRIDSPPDAFETRARRAGSSLSRQFSILVFTLSPKGARTETYRQNPNREREACAGEPVTRWQSKRPRS
jgi:hypothetical protein